MFSCKVPVTISGSYSARTISAFALVSTVPCKIGISPRIAMRRVDLPEPTAPITATF